MPFFFIKVINRVVTKQLNFHFTRILLFLFEISVSRGNWHSNQIALSLFSFCKKLEKLWIIPWIWDNVFLSRSVALERLMA